jgi:hypothetical protein
VHLSRQAGSTSQNTNPSRSTTSPVVTGDVVERDGFVFCDVLPA